MSILCCGVKYSKNDADTYWCFDTDIIKPVTKKYIGNERVIKEVVDSVTCKKCGALIVLITRYGNFRGKKKLLERERLTGNKAINFLKETSKNRISQVVKCPLKNVPFSKYIDFKYGKVIDSETQRARYLNEQGWASDEKIKSKCKITKI